MVDRQSSAFGEAPPEPAIKMVDAGIGQRADPQPAHAIPRRSTELNQILEGAILGLVRANQAVGLALLEPRCFGDAALLADLARDSLAEFVEIALEMAARGGAS